jgi:hypothetical protein
MGTSADRVSDPNHGGGKGEEAVKAEEAEEAVKAEEAEEAVEAGRKEG